MRLFRSLLLCAALSAAAASGAAQAQDAASNDEALKELSRKTFVFEALRHLNRWYLEDEDAQRAIKDGALKVWIKKESPQLDPNDRSLFARMYFPQHSIELRLKKCDYSVPELSVDVKSSSFKIYGVERKPAPSAPPEGCLTMEIDVKEVLDYMFQTRDKLEYPDKTLFERMRKALKVEIDKEPKLVKARESHPEQIVHIAPLSPIANETWVYLENGNFIVRFSSDIDLANPVVWENENLMVKVYDILEQVVLSRDEAPGSNRFVTRATASRIIFNCMVFGERVVLKPGEPKKD